MADSRFFLKNWEKATAFVSGMLFLAVVLVIVLAVPNPTPTQWFVFRVVLALAAAGIGAVIPGLIVVNVSTFVRAGGAIALFVMVYLFDPPQLVIQPKLGDTVQQTTEGMNSPAIVSGRDVTINDEPKATPKQKTK